MLSATSNLSGFAWPAHPSSGMEDLDECESTIAMLGHWECRDATQVNRRIAYPLFVHMVHQCIIGMQSYVGGKRGARAPSWKDYWEDCYSHKKPHPLPAQHADNRHHIMWSMSHAQSKIVLQPQATFSQGILIIGTLCGSTDLRCQEPSPDSRWRQGSKWGTQHCDAAGTCPKRSLNGGKPQDPAEAPTVRSLDTRLGMRKCT